MQTVNVTERKRLDSILSKEDIEKKHIDEVIELMNRYGSISYALEFSKKHSITAKRSIENFTTTKHTKSLTEIADFVVSRHL